MPYFNLILRSALLILLLFQHDELSAQTNFYRLSTGASFGLTRTSAGDKKPDVSLAGEVNLDYFLFPFLTFGTALQKGTLKGGEGLDKYTNHYFYVNLNGKLHIGDFFNPKEDSFLLNTLQGIYLGPGLGLIFSDVNLVNRKYKIPNKEIIMPVNIGVNFDVKNRYNFNRVVFNLNYQAVPFLDRGMDGDFRPENMVFGYYNYFSVGLKYNFGAERFYR